ncbi:MAG: ribosome-associated translation inhibitor RaiA [Pseudomonadota bacterium]
MSVKVSGKGIDVGDALRTRIEDRLAMALDKYFDGGHAGNVTLVKERSGFEAECVVHLDTGIVLQGGGSAGDAYQAFEQSAEHLEKRLRRYKRRLKDHRASAVGKAEAAMAYVLQAPDLPDDAEDADVPDNPLVIAEGAAKVPSLSVADAVMALDLADAPALVFRHATSGRVNVVYRRNDGHIGWTDPEDQAAS